MSEQIEGVGIVRKLPRKAQLLVVLGVVPKPPPVYLQIRQRNASSNFAGITMAHKSKGSEANRVIDHFNNLSVQEQQEIIDFLRAL